MIENAIRFLVNDWFVNKACNEVIEYLIDIELPYAKYYSSMALFELADTCRANELVKQTMILMEQCPNGQYLEKVTPQKSSVKELFESFACSEDEAPSSSSDVRKSNFETTDHIRILMYQNEEVEPEPDSTSEIGFKDESKSVEFIVFECCARFEFRKNISRHITQHHGRKRNGTFFLSVCFVWLAHLKENLSMDNYKAHHKSNHKEQAWLFEGRIKESVLFLKPGYTENICPF